MKVPVVSIIVPNYNHSQFLQQRLDSIFNQSFQNFEIVLLDDASTDNSREILLKFQDHVKVSHVIINRVNSGSPFKQWQKGIDLAIGEYIWIAESDDYCEPNFLESMLKCSLENTVLCYCATKNVDANGMVLGMNIWSSGLDKMRWLTDFKNIGANEIKEYLKYRNTIPNASAVIFKKKIINKVLIPVHMNYCGDWYIWIELLKQGDISYVCTPLNYFRKHQNTSRTLKNFKNERQRFTEYFYIVTSNSTWGSRRGNPHKYNWILEEWATKRPSFGLFYTFLLGMPLDFLIRFLLKSYKR